MLVSPSHFSSHRQVYWALVPGSVPQTHSVLPTNTNKGSDLLSADKVVSLLHLTCCMMQSIFVIMYQPLMPLSYYGLPSIILRTQSPASCSPCPGCSQSVSTVEVPAVFDTQAGRQRGRTSGGLGYSVRLVAANILGQVWR